MNALTQDIKRLALHANFEAICARPRAKFMITNLCSMACEVDPEFFSDSGAFEQFYDDTYADCSDFDLMVHALKEIHVQTLFEDNSCGFHGAVTRYSFPSRWGRLIDRLLDALLDCSNIPAAGDTAVYATTNLNCNDIIDTEFVEFA